MIAERLVAAWNSHDPAAVAALYAPDGVRDEAAYPGQRLQGGAAIAAGVGAIMAAWPDCVLEMRGHSAEGELETFEWTFRGHQQQPYGPLPAHGGHVALRGVSVLATAGDRVREERVYWDTATLMASAGLIEG